MKKFIYKIDHNVAEVFHKFFLWGGDFSNGLMRGISFIADAGIMLLLAGLILLLFKRTRKCGLATLLALAIGFLLTNVILKNCIERVRPYVADRQYWRWWLDAGANIEHGYAFPSGHTTATMAFALAIFLTTKKKNSWPILFLPILMACSRIYLMVHYFSDCVGGVLAGAVSAITAYFIVRLMYKSDLKFFVWVRNVNIFGKKQIASTPIVIEDKKVEPKIEEYSYRTQKEENEKIESQTLIQRDIEDVNDDEENKDL